MSIPLDNLYHWVDSLMPGPANLYVFRPHGSKKISDLSWLNDYDKKISYKFPSIVMHDQEPLDWDFYDCPDQYMELFHLKKWEISAVNNLRINYFSTFNLKFLTLLNGVIYDQDILIHSEKNSKDLVQYQQNGFVTVHYWAHAVIARDWYRFAQYDTRLNSSNLCKNKFLIYCRDWSHRREYRLKFLELLIQNNLDQVSQTSVMHVNGENVHFSQHQFCNSKFNLDNLESISSISSNAFSSSASADYNPEDFVESEISVVLETVFDDSRVHLTEKTLRPIACGHPFILAAGPGALEYIRSYGFKTFAPWIDESYDLETDSFKRLEKIINAMVKIQNLQGSELEEFSQGIKDIANFNKKHFFSNEFFNTVKNELQHNLQVAYKQVKKTKGKHYLEILKTVKKHGLVHLFQLRRERTQLIRQLRQSCQDDLSNPQEDPAV
jgi:hypothetical protein